MVGLLVYIKYLGIGRNLLYSKRLTFEDHHRKSFLPMTHMALTSN